MRKRFLALLFSVFILCITVVSSFAYSDVDFIFMPFQPTLTVGQKNVESPLSDLAIFTVPVVGEPVLQYSLGEFTASYDNGFLTSRVDVTNSYRYSNEFNFGLGQSVSSLLYTAKLSLLDSDHLDFSFNAGGNSVFIGFYSYSYRDLNSNSTDLIYVSNSFTSGNTVQPFSNLSNNPNTYFLISDFRLSFQASVNVSYAYTTFQGTCLTYAEWNSLSGQFIDILGSLTTGDYNDGYDAGFTDGQGIGYGNGYDAGLAVGLSMGYSSGYTAGYDEGYDEGYADGVLVADSDIETAYENGYSLGFIAGQTQAVENYESGYADGYTDGFSEGNDHGYSNGYNAGLSDGASIDFDLVSWLGDALENFFTFQLYGDVTLGLIVTVVLSVLVLLAVIKWST